jgi:hypothetical protein
MLAECGRAHTYHWTYETFLERIHSEVRNEKVREVTIKVLLLFGI